MHKILFVLLFLNSIVFANNITVIGYGDTKDKALKSAFQNAVEQEVGVLVDTKTVIRNGNLIKNNILSFSNGFIKDYNEISAKQQMGFWTVKISAVVEHQKLLSKLKKIKINPRQIKGTKQLYARVVSQVKTKFDAEDLFKKFYRTFTSVPTESYYAKVIDFNIDTELATRKTVPVKVTATIYWIDGEAPIVRKQLDSAYNLMKKLSTTMTLHKDLSFFQKLGGSVYNNEIRVKRADGTITHFGFPRSYSVIYPFNRENGFGEAKRQRTPHIVLLFLDKNNHILKRMNPKGYSSTLDSMVSGFEIGTYDGTGGDYKLNWNMPIKYLKRISQVKAKIVWK